MNTVLALDPGGMTGWSMWQFSDEMPLTHVEHGMIPGGLLGFIDWWETTAPAATVVVAEAFELDGRTPKPDLTPRDIEGALTVFRRSWVRQPNTFKAQMPDEALKRLGLWWKGAGHDRDSARHAFAYMRSIRHRPTLELLYPRPNRAAA